MASMHGNVCGCLSLCKKFVVLHKKVTILCNTSCSIEKKTVILRVVK